MTKSIEISKVSIRLMPDGTGSDDLIGYASCVVNNALYLNNIAIKQKPDRSLRLLYPIMRNHRGERFNHFNPVSREVAAAFEKAIIGEFRPSMIVTER